jgi:hypothetical protein
MDAKGATDMAIVVVVENAAQLPVAATVYVTVYVPGVLAEGIIAPVVTFSDNPVVEL